MIRSEAKILGESIVVGNFLGPGWINYDFRRTKVQCNYWRTTEKRPKNGRALTNQLN
jgi:hypothetical protein